MASPSIFLRQPVGSSDLAVTFYSFDDLCEQTSKACTTPPGVADPNLEHFSLAHDQEYILPLLKKALAINPEMHVMLTPWSPPGWMKSSGSMLGSNPETKETSSLRPEFYAAFANYLVKTIQGYQAAGVPIWALSVQNEPLYAPPTYSGMQCWPTSRRTSSATRWRRPWPPRISAPKSWPTTTTGTGPIIPRRCSKIPRPARWPPEPHGTTTAAIPAVMTKIHEEFPQKDQWVTESSGGTWQNGNIFAEEARELIAVTRNWSRGYVLWALATDQNHGPVVGGCDTCRGLVTIDLSDPARPQVKPELDYYVLGHASKFLLPGAVRIASDEPAGTKLKDVAFRNPNGTVVLYALNDGADQPGLPHRLSWKDSGHHASRGFGGHLRLEALTAAGYRDDGGAPPAGGAPCGGRGPLWSSSGITNGSGSRWPRWQVPQATGVSAPSIFIT